MEDNMVSVPVCDDCGQHLFPPDEPGLVTVDGGNNVCQKCIENYRYSENCGEWLHESDAVYSEAMQDYLHCEESFTCDDCGDIYHVNDGHTVGYGDYDICEGCRDNGNYAYPYDDDGTLYHIDNLYWCDRAEEYFADADNAPSSRVSEYLHCYSTDVICEIGAAVIGANGRMSLQTAIREKVLCYGVELETGSRDYNGAAEIAEHLCENTDFQEYGICKEDGSIDGAEMVTLPATLAGHRKVYDWDAWCFYLREVARGHYGNAGMHIHVNRAAISPLTLGKILVFCNDPNNVGLLSCIAQRDIDNCSWCEQYPHNYDKVGKAGKHGNTSGKYSAVNVTMRTVEFRIFNSNLRHERILKNLEFCESLVKWCRVVSARDINAENYVRYVHDNRKAYPELSKYLAENFTIKLSEETKLCA